MDGTKLAIASVVGGVPAVLVGAMGANLLVDAAIAGIFGYIAWEFSPELQSRTAKFLPQISADRLPIINKVDWKGVFAGESEVKSEQVAPHDAQPDEESEVSDNTQEETAMRDEAVPFDNNESDDGIELLSFGERKITVFSDLLKTGWRPTLDQIYVGTDTKGRHLFVPAHKLCHVALAGATGHGKSSLMRLIMAQLCYLKLPVALLNPHYMVYDSDHKEDWTPYTPYLYKDPMECRKIKNIEKALRWMAEELLLLRKERCSHGGHAGVPFFFILDEYPDIKAEIEGAPIWVGKILRQGRKYNIFLIIASQDFAVKTLGVEGEGSVRKCFLTTFYVGGDSITAKELLNKPVRDIPENDLGQGTIMLKCAGVEEPLIVHVPYLDNRSLYILLGPTTFVPSQQEGHTEDLEVLAIPSSSSEHSELPDKTEPLSSENEQDESPEQPSSSSSLHEEWTEEDIITARRLAQTVKDKDKLLGLLNKKGTMWKLREDLKQVLGQGEMV